MDKDKKRNDLYLEMEDFFVNKSDQLPGWCVDYVEMWLTKVKQIDLEGEE